MNDLTKLIESITKEALGSLEVIEPAQKEKLASIIAKQIHDAVDLASLKSKLSMLYEYEKNYLDLIKSYKEEIKFASSIQEDLRKERAKFFSETLKEVSNTLSQSQVDNEVASSWLKELVDSYTKSLDLSGGLIEEHALDMVGKMRSYAKSNKSLLEINENN